MTPLDTPAIRKAWDAYRNASHGTRQHYRRAYEAAVREQLMVDTYDWRLDFSRSWELAVSELRRDLLARKGEGEG